MPVAKLEEALRFYADPKTYEASWLPRLTRTRSLRRRDAGKGCPREALTVIMESRGDGLADSPFRFLVNCRRGECAGTCAQARAHRVGWMEIRQALWPLRLLGRVSEREHVGVWFYFGKITCGMSL